MLPRDSDAGQKPTPVPHCDAARVAPPFSSKHYFVNLSLFSLIAVLLTVWFYLHLYLYFTEALLIGGTLSAWGLWRIVYPVIRRLLGARAPRMSGIVATPGLTEYLGLGLMVVITLFLFTSSVYIEYEGAEQGESEFKVEVLYRGNPYLDTLRVASYDRVAGQPFFFRVSKITLEFNIRDPRGYKTEVRTLQPWTNVHLRVPRDFVPKEYHVVRLVPGKGLFNLLPRATDSPSTGYYLHVTRTNRRYTLEDFRQGIVYVGADETDLSWLLKTVDQEKGTNEVEEYFTKRGAPTSLAQERVKRLESHWVALTTAEFMSADSVTVEVGTSDGGPLLVKEFIVNNVPGVQTIFLEVSQ